MIYFNLIICLFASENPALEISSTYGDMRNFYKIAEFYIVYKVIRNNRKSLE